MNTLTNPLFNLSLLAHQSAPLPSLRAMRRKDGPPLPVDEQLCGRGEPEVLYSVPLIRACGGGLRHWAGHVPLHRVHS